MGKAIFGGWEYGWDAEEGTRPGDNNKGKCPFLLTNNRNAKKIWTIYPKYLFQTAEKYLGFDSTGWGLQKTVNMAENCVMSGNVKITLLDGVIGNWP